MKTLTGKEDGDDQYVRNDLEGRGTWPVIYTYRARIPMVVFRNATETLVRINISHVEIQIPYFPNESLAPYRIKYVTGVKYDLEEATKAKKRE